MVETQMIHQQKENREWMAEEILFAVLNSSAVQSPQSMAQNFHIMLEIFICEHIHYSNDLPSSPCKV